ncbi:hypothetical protein [Variovorax ginsengisoli]|uniref:Uncharacterized protein n=1 Tax=Variovorax ginsengisoli TaxID=363844 RepID=A0ABT8SI82_9BURK|nr:hypothetical protein [Variovorax ginsengisoli]MDN8618929.1 hypothetical protein [Variovorax ginsengisoli]MDO1538099.1 hypothetical protein [Variovorax ginsengisoli]
MLKFDGQAGSCGSSCSLLELLYAENHQAGANNERCHAENNPAHQPLFLIVKQPGNGSGEYSKKVLRMIDGSIFFLSLEDHPSDTKIGEEYEGDS